MSVAYLGQSFQMENLQGQFLLSEFSQMWTFIELSTVIINQSVRGKECVILQSVGFEVKVSTCSVLIRQAE